jgi:hypothetical protein
MGSHQASAGGQAARALPETGATDDRIVTRARRGGEGGCIYPCDSALRFINSRVGRSSFRE